MAKEKQSAASNKDKYNERRWSIPSKRAKGYAEDRKAKVHTYGKKEGKELTDFEAGIRSGYLQCQGDPVCISTKRLSPKANPKKKRVQFRAKNPSKED